ncbi:MAG: outer membrane protein assembly factor BamD [Deltaproteobacteria bacterium]|nr:outer membrane protein assembly factor BamD [Deltaproteobacteria bacterium]
MLVAISVIMISCSTRNAMLTTKQNVTVDERFARALYYYQTSKYSDAEGDLKVIIYDYPLTSYAIEAQLLMADINYARDDFEEAASYYTTFWSLYPSHPSAPYALFQKGMSYLNKVLLIDRDQTYTRTAMFSFSDILTYYPESIYAERADKVVKLLFTRLAKKELEVGKFYLKTKNYSGALLRFKSVMSEYPDAGLNDQILYYVGKTYIKLDEKELAIQAFETLLESYPESVVAEKAKEILSGG